MLSQLAAKTAVLVSGPVVARSRQHVKATASAESRNLVDTFSSQVEEPTAAMETRVDEQVKTVDNVVRYQMALAENGSRECAGHCPKYQPD